MDLGAPTVFFNNLRICFFMVSCFSSRPATAHRSKNSKGAAEAAPLP
jgi:hypothetical protein